MSLTIALDIEADAWRDLPDLEGLVDRTLDRACRLSARSVEDGAEVSVLLCDDNAIRTLNRDWRGMDKATNVLSFPAAGPAGGPRLLGDIAVAWETTRREAIDQGITVPDHLTHLLVHGLLHLVGYDHQDGAEAEAMEALESGILGDLGVADPYRDTVPEEHASP